MRVHEAQAQQQVGQPVGLLAREMAEPGPLEPGEPGACLGALLGAPTHARIGQQPAQRLDVVGQDEASLGGVEDAPAELDREEAPLDLLGVAAGPPAGRQQQLDQVEVRVVLRLVRRVGARQVDAPRVVEEQRRVEALADLVGPRRGEVGLPGDEQAEELIGVDLRARAVRPPEAHPRQRRLGGQRAVDRLGGAPGHGQVDLAAQRLVEVPERRGRAVGPEAIAIAQGGRAALGAPGREQEGQEAAAVGLGAVLGPEVEVAGRAEDAHRREERVEVRLLDGEHQRVVAEVLLQGLADAGQLGLDARPDLVLRGRRRRRARCEREQAGGDEETADRARSCAVHRAPAGGNAA